MRASRKQKMQPFRKRLHLYLDNVLVAVDQIITPRDVFLALQRFYLVSGVDLGDLRGVGTAGRHLAFD